MKRNYYEINEQQARTAKTLNSFSDYVPGAATTDYKTEVNSIYELAEAKAKEYPERVEKLEKLANRYSKNMANYINEGNRIDAMCPSVMICGGGNFPVRKKEKQNAARDRHFKSFDQFEEIKHKIECIGSSNEIIKSNDANAVDKLQQKLDKLTENHEMMKRANAYFRKNKTMIGFEEWTEATTTEFMASYNNGDYFSQRPYMPFELTNSNAKIKSTRTRLENLKEMKNSDSAETETEFFKVIENTELARLQLIFDEKPDESTRKILKSHGFRWAPSQNAWQRQLTNNARYALKSVLKELKA